jgi:hypothetical protein
MKTISRIALMTGVVAVATAALCFAGPSATEQARIDALLSHVSNMKGTEFIRNGKAHDAATAATFLTRKFRAHGSSVTNANDFIAQIATKSSTSGRPYRIRLPDGTETNCAAYLNGVLRSMNMERPNSTPEDIRR